MTDPYILSELHLARVLSTKASVGALPSPTTPGLRLGDARSVIAEQGIVVLADGGVGGKYWLLLTSVPTFGTSNVTVTPGAGASKIIDVDVQTSPETRVLIEVVDTTDGSNVTPSKTGGTPGTEFANSGAAAYSYAIGITEPSGGDIGRYVARFTGATAGHTYQVLVTSASQLGSADPNGAFP